MLRESVEKKCLKSTALFISYYIQEHKDYNLKVVINVHITRTKNLHLLSSEIIVTDTGETKI